MSPAVFAELDLVVVFGSQARGTAGPESDLDVAVLPRGPVAPCPEALPEQLRRHFGQPKLDLVWLPDASWLLWQEVARDGKAAWEASSGAFERFCGDAHQRGVDAQVWRERDQRFLQRYLKGDWRLNQDLIRRKLAQLARYLHELEPVVLASQERFLQDPLLHHAGERLVEILVECAASINTELAQAHGIPPSDYYSSFFSLARTGWVTKELCESLAECVRLRKALVHRYEDLGLDQVHAGIQRFAPLWREYLAQIQSRL